MSTTIAIDTPGQGFVDITSTVDEIVRAGPVTCGLCCLHLLHTSASLTIQENADPSARADLEAWLQRAAPEGDPAWTHTHEGPDDMPSHVRAMLTGVSLAGALPRDVGERQARAAEDVLRQELPAGVQVAIEVEEDASCASPGSAVVLVAETDTGAQCEGEDGHRAGGGRVPGERVRLRASSGGVGRPQARAVEAEPAPGRGGGGTRPAARPRRR